MVDLAQTFHDLIRVETALWNAVDNRLQDSCGLTLARFETMRVLQQFGPCRVLDVSEHLTISWSAVSKIVDRVAGAGHCRRHPNPADARSSLIALTPLGRSVTTQATAILQDELEQRLATALSPTELDQLGRSLAHLRTVG
jgi:DNA-binding MarR family transcriptional regulator